MKQFYLILSAVFTISLNAQIVSIPDANFKSALLETNPDLLNATDIDGNYIVVDANGDSQIQVTEAQAVYSLYVPYMGISDLTGIQSFSNLEYLDITYNDIAMLDISNMSNLMYLVANENILTSLNMSGCTNLYSAELDYNLLTSLDCAGLVNLETLIVSHNALMSINVAGLSNLSMLELTDNQLDEIDLTGCVNMGFLSVAYNNLQSLDLTNLEPIDPYVDGNPITFLNIKNGFDDSDSNITIFDTPLEYLCVDEMETAAFVELIEWFEMTVSINSYCSFAPGGTYYTVHGNSTLDEDNEGCDSNDNAYPDLKLLINGGAGGTLIADGSGEYSISLTEGAYTFTPVFENPDYFNVFPTSFAANFPTDASPLNQNFCVSPNGVHPDIEITMFPLDAAVPGFDAEYRIVCKNIGNQLMSGTVVFNFENDVIEVLSADPAPTDQGGNMVSWDFTNLSPFQSQEISIWVNLNAPTETPPLNIDDILAFSVTASTVAEDENPANNTYAIDEIVVGSFDPNDIRCLEGEVVSTDIVGEYVHYLILFENTGTFPAQNIVVRNMIDINKFDINTLTPISGSHSYVTKVSNGNRVEFMFEDIQLPFDDANNDGYIAYKMRTKNTLVAGNTFSNQAGIYFDYNFPVETNTFVTTIEALGTQDFDFAEHFTLYPNPAGNTINIRTKSNAEINAVHIYNTLGQIVIAIPDAQALSQIDISPLRSGQYFIKVNSDKGTSASTFLKY